MRIACLSSGRIRGLWLTQLLGLAKPSPDILLAAAIALNRGANLLALRDIGAISFWPAVAWRIAVLTARYALGCGKARGFDPHRV